MDNKDKILNTENDSLETADTSVDSGVVAAPEGGKVVTAGAALPTETEAPKAGFLKRVLEKINIYFISLIVLLVLLGLGAFFAYVKNNESSKESNLKTQTLNQDSLDKLSGSDTTVGDAKQTLTIASNAIFSGGILVNGNLDVIGTLKLGGALSLPGLNVGGTTTLDKAALKTLTVAGDTSIQGKLTLQNNLSVNGSGAFNGPVSAPQITVDTLQLSKDLQISKHIVANGATPSRTQGSALGSGGTSTVNGSDTAGSIVINTGSSAPAGCFITVNFTTAYNTLPHVVISPTSSTAAILDYYVNRTTSGFSVCAATDPPDNAAGMTFDYVIVG